MLETGLGVEDFAETDQSADGPFRKYAQAPGTKYQSLKCFASKELWQKMVRTKVLVWSGGSKSRVVSMYIMVAQLQSMVPVKSEFLLPSS